VTTDEPVTRGAPMLPGPAESRFAGPADDPDRYELTGEGIVGGEGVTWRARYTGHLTAPLPFAVKMLRPPPSPGPAGSARDDRRRWLDRAALLRYMRLEHVVHVHEVFFGAPPHAEGTGPAAESVAYIVMEWLDGPTLHEAVRGAPVTAQNLGRRLGYLEDAASALAALASTSRSAGNPSLHRDVKPANCIVTADRGLVLIDVSTVRLLDDGFDPAGLHTPGYTAPEVLDAPHRARTPASDMYALGALALFCLTGREPAPVRDANAALRLQHELSLGLHEAGLSDPAALAAHVVAAVDPDPARRPRDPVDWSRQARLLAARRARPGRRLGWVAAGIAAGTALVVAAGVSVGATLSRDRAPAPVVSRHSAAASAAVGTTMSGKITSPGDGSNVPQCANFAGTSHLDPGWTLVLAMRNTQNNDPHWYDQDVVHWDTPEVLARWRGYQYFGQVDAGIGQHYEVQLIAVRLDALRHVNPADYGEVLNRTGTVLDTVHLTRVAGSGPNGCDGPP
jgi:serine/threonine protein kinase